ncbi:carboxyl transferase domain-containing protein [Nostocoides vanveenii]|jgi:acetyl-CoA carboxylase alpha subunit|uniref:Carboxyl transferase domain-containing protein n=1 Tax=Nostocoides vanveenii TaxID=330835 RepID=A0ABN2KGW3_9MICO
MAEPRTRLGARELFDAVLDPGSFVSWDGAVHAVTEPNSTYAVELAEAAQRAGTDESIITGEGRIGGRRVALIAGEFRFLAGSIGRTSAERIVLAFERATREGLPLFAGPASGGTRMQEGTPAFATMVKITAAVSAFKAAKLPYITYLRHPTTGGVFASWGSLGHVTVAEPGATIGFLGARVYEALYGQSFPDGVQTAENLYANGLLDAILPVDELTATAERFLDLVLAPRVGSAIPESEPTPWPDIPAWESIVRTRRPERPGVRELLKLGASDVIPLHGTGAGEWDRSLFLALARFGGMPCVVLGQDRRHTPGPGGALETADKPLSPSGLRVARRGMKLATELDLPLVSVIDTSGAALSRAAEEGGLAGEIARCLAELVAHAEPTLCVLLGQGTGGGAIALMPADRVIAAQHSWLSPLPPEGASAILYRTTEHAPHIAAQQRIRSIDLLADGIVDRVVAEHPDAADEPAEFCRRMAQAIAGELTRLTQMRAASRLAARHDRYRRLG